MRPVTLIAHPLPIRTSVVAVSWDAASNLPVAHAWVNHPAIETMGLREHENSSDPEDSAFGDFCDNRLGCNRCPLAATQTRTITLSDVPSLVSELEDSINYVHAYEDAEITLEPVCFGAESQESYCPRHECCINETDLYNDRYNYYAEESCQENSSINSPPLYVMCTIQPDGSAEQGSRSRGVSMGLYPLLAIQAIALDDTGNICTSAARGGLNMFAASEPPYAICWGNTPKVLLRSLRDAHTSYLATPGNEDLLSVEEVDGNVREALDWLEDMQSSEDYPPIPCDPLPNGLTVVYSAFNSETPAPPAALLLATSLDHPSAFARLVASGAMPLRGRNHAYVALPLFEHSLAIKGRTVQGLRTEALAGDRSWFILPQPASTKGWLGHAIGQLNASEGYAPCE